MVLINAGGLFCLSSRRVNHHTYSFLFVKICILLFVGAPLSQAGWKLQSIGGKLVKTSEDVTAALAANKKKGKPYKIKFETAIGKAAAGKVAKAGVKGKPGAKVVEKKVEAKAPTPEELAAQEALKAKEEEDRQRKEDEERVAEEKRQQLEAKKKAEEERRKLEVEAKARAARDAKVTTQL